MSDPGTSYRSRDEVQEVRQTRDPITSFREKIISKNLATAEEIKVNRMEPDPSLEQKLKFIVDFTGTRGENP